MEKRLPLALFLSFLVLFGWQILFPPTPPAQTGDSNDTENASQDSTGSSADPSSPTGTTTAPAPAEPVLAATEEESLVLTFGTSGEPGYFEASFSNRGGRLTGLKLGDFVTGVGFDDAQRADHGNWMPLIQPIETADGTLGSLLFETSPSSSAYFPNGLDQVLWQMEPLAEGDGVRFRYGASTGVTVTKEIARVPGTWRLALSLSIENGSTTAARDMELRLRVAGAMVPEFGDRFYPEPRSVAVGGDDPNDLDIEWEAGPSISEKGALDVSLPIAFVGDHNKYFAFLVHGATPAERKSLRSPLYEPVREVGADGFAGRDLISTVVPLALRLPDPGQSSSWRYEIYAGPKAPDSLNADAPEHAILLDEDLSSWFDTIAAIGKGLLWVMGIFHGMTGNWGVAIILLTICVRLALFPLNRRTQTAMARYQKKMKRVQPKLEEVKERHKNDLQKQREAQAKIMQEEGAFPPLGGCLPIFLQFPVFIGLFSALRSSFDLRQAPFAGWIEDLSKPDRLLELDLDIPLLITTLEIDYLNLLPLLMIGLMIWQQQGMPKPTDEQAQRMQRMMMIMPFMFAFFLYNYAAGLSLYVITSSAIGIIEQKVIKKIWPIDDTEVEPKKGPSGCGPFSGAMQNLAEKQKEQMRLLEEQRRRQGAQGGSKKGKRKKR